MTYDTAKIRRFLIEQFSDGELNALCFDYFLDVYHNFGQGMGKSDKVQQLLDHCGRHGRFPNLLAALEQLRPTLYDQAFPAQSYTAAAPPPTTRNPHQVFISHAHQDSKFAHQLATDLQTHGLLVWIAPENIRPGEKWVDAINRGLEESGIFVLALTPDAVNSRWVRDETNAAIELKQEGKIQFIPLRVKPCQMPPLWRVYQRISFEQDYQTGLQTLLTHLGIRPASPPKPAPVAEPQRPSPVMLNEVPGVKHPTGAERKWILRSEDSTQNDRGLRGLLNKLRVVPVVWGWGVVGMLLVVLVWTLWGGNGQEPAATEVPQSAPTLTQEPLPLTATPRAVATATAPAGPTHTVAPEPSETPPAPAAGQTQIRAADGMVMVYVPGGTFQMGSDDNDTQAASDEKPQHLVTLDDFWIDQTEVTNAQFTTFVDETGYETTAETEGNSYIFTGPSWELVNGADWQHPQGPNSNLAGLDDHPVVLVSWTDANAYCQWAGGALPTEAQWEYAARGWENLIYPWGNTFDGTLLNFCDANCLLDWRDGTIDGGYEFTSPVGNYPTGASWVGALDMAGNVWEWVADSYDSGYYGISVSENPVGPAETGYKVLRGGSWDTAQPSVRAASRVGDTPTVRYVIIGFRCVVPPGS